MEKSQNIFLHLKVKVNNINGEKTRLCKEYHEDKLIFEGYYLNFKRHGKGKEYDYKRNLLFEGEYLNGKRWEGIIYNKEKNLEFIIKNGNGKVKKNIYNEHEIIIFKGEYINGEKNGNVIQYKKISSYNILR